MLPDSKHAIWVDPLAFDLLENGPPYLPERSMRSAAGLSGTLFEKVLTNFSGLPMSELGALVAVLRAASIVHQSHHWQTRGSSSYGDHLMFMRVYDESQGFIDQVAERGVGSGSVDLVCPRTQSKVLPALVGYWCGGGSTTPSAVEMVSASLLVERCVLSCLKEARVSLESKGALSDGTDNLLQGVADKHEEFVYLFQQRLGEKSASSYAYRRD